MASKKNKTKVGEESIEAKADRRSKTLDGESSRGAILVGFEMVDDYLTELIKDRLRIAHYCALVEAQGVDEILIDSRPKLADRLFQHPNILLVPASRQDFAYVLGWIDSGLYSDLKVMRAIRNLAAHSDRPISFSEGEIETELKKLKSIGWEHRETEGQNKLQFIRIVYRLMVRLLDLSIGLHEQRDQLIKRLHGRIKTEVAALGGDVTALEYALEEPLDRSDTSSINNQ